MRQSKWTVLVYMAAGDSVALDANAVRDLQEMERATIGDDVAVVVQINRAWPKQPQRYRISSAGSRLERANVPDENMGDGATLLNFLTWAEGAYPADKFFLILWGHAYGLGFGRDHGDALTLGELTDALGKFQVLRGKKLELLVECLRHELPGSGVRAAEGRALSGRVPNLGAVRRLALRIDPEPGEFREGWPRPGGDHRRSLRQRREPVGDDRIALTLLDLSVAEELKDLVSKLTSAITRVIRERVRSAVDRLSQVHTAFMATVAGDIRPLVDAADLCDELMAMCGDLVHLEARGPASLQAVRG